MGACESIAETKTPAYPSSSAANAPTPSTLARESESTADARITRALRDAERKERLSFKLLLLGAGECGKSTILKQMKILHKDGFGPEERRSFIELIYANTLQSIQVLIQACYDLNIKFYYPELEQYAQSILALPKLEPSQSLIDQISLLYQSSSIQHALTQTHLFYCLDSAPYFLSKVDRTLSPNYMPTDADILHTRLPTSGIIDTEFNIDALNFHLFDVGGQRGERKKWIHCFQNVHAILFIASLNEFDQKLAEDQSKNRFFESLNLFEGIISLPWFKATNIILFLNKNDLFLEKIQRVDLSDYFSDFDPAYNGNYEEALEYMKELYFNKNTDPNKIIYAHVTDATDTKQIEFVWGATKQIIVQTNLQRAGLIT